MRNKAMFLGIISTILLGAPISLALNIDAQSTSSCLLGSCQTTVDLTKWFTSGQIAAIKGINLKTALPKRIGIENISYKFDGSKLVIFGNISRDVYWNMNVSSYANIDPWWNITLSSQNWTNPASSCGTAGGGGNYFGVVLIPNTTTGSMKIVNITIKSGTVLTNNWVNITNMAGNILYASNTNTSKVYFFTNAYLNASQAYYIKMLSTTRTSCSPSFNYTTDHFNVSKGIYCLPINSCNNLTNEIFEIDGIGSQTSSGVYYDFKEYLNGNEANITLTDIGSLNVTAHANLSQVQINITIYENGTIRNSTIADTPPAAVVTYLASGLGTGMYNFTATTNNSDSVTWWANVSKFITPMDMRVCFKTRDVCVDVNTFKVYIGKGDLIL